VIAQPENRGTGVAIATAILMLRDLDPEAIVAAFPCDHHYSDEAAFLNVIEAGIEVARSSDDTIVLIAAEATYPETEYGWIEPVQSAQNGARFAPARVRQFWEKPTLALAYDLQRRGCLCTRRPLHRRRQVTRYIGRHGTKRVEKVFLIAAVPPILLKSDANPEGIPIEVFDGLRAGLAKDPSQFYKDFAMMFYGANRAGAKVSQCILDEFWLWSMQGSVKSIYECIKAFSETDFTEDLKKFDVPALVLHGDDDQVVPVMISSKKSAKMIRGAQEIYYPGAPHGVTATDPDRINADLLEFLKKGRKTSKAA
jgi:pimeloyl-ACP methyl ester carboxylesterase